MSATPRTRDEAEGAAPGTFRMRTLSTLKLAALSSGQTEMQALATSWQIEDSASFLVSGLEEEASAGVAGTNVSLPSMTPPATTIPSSACCFEPMGALSRVATAPASRTSIVPDPGRMSLCSRMSRARAAVRA